MRTFCNILLGILAVGLIQCGTGSVNETDIDAPDNAPSIQKAAILTPLSGIFPGAWETLVSGYAYSDAPAVDQDGNIYYSAIMQDRIYKITPAGNVSLFDENTARTMGLMFAPDGRLIGCRNYDAQIIAYDMQGGREVLLQGELTPDPRTNGDKKEFCNGLVVSSSGDIWFNDRINQQVIHLDASGKHRVVASGFRPNGIILSLDEKILVTTDSNDPKLWAFDVLEDGSLREKPDYFDPVLLGKAPKKWPKMAGKPGTNGMTVDPEGRYYVTSFMGIQVFQADGTFLGLMENPAPFLSDVAYSGLKSGYIYATGRGGLYRIPVMDSAVRYTVDAD
jgi:gluconolactonase